MHSHTAKVLKWGVDKDANYYVALYGCTDCDETFTESPSNGMVKSEHEHDSYVPGCFTCKLPTLQLNVGDANSGLIDNGWTRKSWDGELAAYKSARSQGIQPDSTKMADIQKAVDISNKTGHAYGSKL